MRVVVIQVKDLKQRLRRSVSDYCWHIIMFMGYFQSNRARVHVEYETLPGFVRFGCTAQLQDPSYPAKN